jgi:FKBP-type peptidyl-prolyl cis-trans isomerase 2
MAEGGFTLVVVDCQGRSHLARIHEIKEKTVILDANHPPAEKILAFDVKVLDIRYFYFSRARDKFSKRRHQCETAWSNTAAKHVYEHMMNAPQSNRKFTG